MIALIGVPGIPEIRPGDDLAALLVAACDEAATPILPGDLVVITSKVVSKADGLYVPADNRADLVLQESDAVVSERRTNTGMTRVVSAKAGPVLAGAGIDASNSDDPRLLLLPPDPDASARDLHRRIAAAIGHDQFGVLLSDTAGRPWRAGLTDFALGLAGVEPLDDLRGHADTAGRDLAVTVRNLADAVCAAADLVKGKLDRVPVAIVRGMPELVGPVDPEQGAASLVRRGSSDWFNLGQAEAVRTALGVRPGTPAAAEVGIASVHPEPLRERVERAIAVAMYGRADQLRIDITLTQPREEFIQAQLFCTDAITLGRLWARLEVALAGEQLTSSANRIDGRIELVIRDPAVPASAGPVGPVPTSIRPGGDVPASASPDGQV